MIEAEGGGTATHTGVEVDSVGAESEIGSQAMCGVVEGEGSDARNTPALVTE